MRFVHAVIATTVWSAAGCALAQSVEIRGPSGQTRVVSLSELASMPHDTATLAVEHGPAKHYRGVPLTMLLQNVGAPVGKDLRGPALADFVLVGAGDGYRVVLALAETDPGLGARKVLLADGVDGAPLSPSEGPFRLVIEGDLRPARSARMVTTIRVDAAPVVSSEK
jgi:hypothetical protein